mgnify:FL=1|jgi:Lrp/AsnC family leucine-responsive transcriptional regulator
MNFDIDETDLRLLRLLQKDSGLSNQTLAEQAFLSPATCLRRVKRLRESGLIAREVALLDIDRVATVVGHGLTAIVEITLDKQNSEAQDRFEERLRDEPAVQQCYRVSPGPDFVLVLFVTDMPAYLALTQRIFSTDANVRNVKTFFSTKRAKFDPSIPVEFRTSAFSRAGSSH